MTYFRWTEKETAILLNHIDWCLVNKQNYWLTIRDKFKQEANRVPTPAQIMTCLKKFCKEQTPKVRYNELVDRGTSALEYATIPKYIVKAMNRRRKKLSLDALEKRRTEIPPAQAGSSQRSGREMELAHNSQSLPLPCEAKKSHRPSNHPPIPRDSSCSSIGESALIRNHSQVDRKRKREISVSYSDVSSSSVVSDTEAVLMQMSTGSDLPAPLRSPTADNNVSHLHKRLKALEKEVKSMSEKEKNTERVLNMAIQCITWVFREQVGPKNKIPHEIFSTMQLVERTIKDTPGDALIRLVKDLQQANVIRQRYQDLVRDLIGPRDFAKKVEFPPLFLPNELAEQWRCIRSPLKDNMAGKEGPASRVQLAMTGSFSNTHLADLANAKEGGTYEPQLWISTRGVHLDNQITAQHLLAVVLCQLLFCRTETLCEVTPASWAFQIYRIVTEDKQVIRHIDRMAFQLFSEQPCFKNEVLPDRIRKVRECLEACAREFTTAVGCTSPFLRLDFMSDEAVNRALSLKRTLMLSLYEYEVHFASPGMDFDPDWMDAENDNGDWLDPPTCKGKKVSICVFPGLVQAPPKKLPADADISAALLQAKSFFPPDQKTSPSQEYDIVVAKAVVLVHDANVETT